MIQNLVIAFEAVAPIFLTIAAGYGIKLAKILDKESIRKINKMLFKALFPLVVWCSLYGASVKEAFNGRLIAYSVLMSIFLWLAAIPAVMAIEKNNKSRGAMIQAMNRSNFLVIGFPVVNSICGKDNIASAALTIVGMLLVNNIMSVIVLEVFRGSKPEPTKILKSILVNPIIIATVLGTAAMVTGLKLPYVFETTISSLGGIASSLALLVMGASLDLKSVGERKRNLIISIIGKLVIVPGIVAFGGVLMGFRGVPFVTLIAFFAASPTTTSYTMADQMGSDGELARDCVVFATALVAFTMFCWIFLFKTMGMF